MKINKKVTIAAALALCLLVSMSSIFAYFSSHDDVTNIFYVGNIKIALREPHWPSGNPPKNMTPSQEQAKDPLIINNGDNDAYVFLKVAVPKEMTLEVRDNGTKIDSSAKLHETFTIRSGNTGSYKPFTTGYNSTGWELLSAYTDTSSSSEYNYYVYGYKQVVRPDGYTTTLFDSVKLINTTENTIEQKKLYIDLQAYGIQADNLPVTSLSDIYGLYLNQNGQ